MSKCKLGIGTTTFLSAVFCLTGCASPYRPSVYPAYAQTIKTTESPDGSSKSWELRRGWLQTPTLQVSETQVRKVARLGVKCSAHPPAAPTDDSVEGGITIVEVLADSPAQRGGLAEGDILLQIDGHDLSSIYALRDYMESLTEPEQAVELTVRRSSNGKAPEQAPHPHQVQIVPERVEVTETESGWTELDPSIGIQHYTGLQAATVSADHATSLYGAEHAVLLVTGVVAGSPAYYAGFRGGDRVLRINGGPANLDELRVAVYERLKAEDQSYLPYYDLLKFENEYGYETIDQNFSPMGVVMKLRENDQNAADDGLLVLEVEGPLGPHRARLPLATTNLDQVTETNLPGILTSRSTVRGTGVQFLDPGFTIGFDYRSYATASTTREPEYNFSLQLLPFGMFEVRKFPNEGVDEVTLFWFLTF